MSTTNPEKDRCSGVYKNGNPCRSYAVIGDLCERCHQRATDVEASAEIDRKARELARQMVEKNRTIHAEDCVYRGFQITWNGYGWQVTAIAYTSAVAYCEATGERGARVGMDCGVYTDTSSDDLKGQIDDVMRGTVPLELETPEGGLVIVSPNTGELYAEIAPEVHQTRVQTEAEAASRLEAKRAGVKAGAWGIGALDDATRGLTVAEIWSLVRDAEDRAARRETEARVQAQGQADQLQAEIAALYSGAGLTDTQIVEARGNAERILRDTSDIGERRAAQMGIDTVLGRLRRQREDRAARAERRRAMEDLHRRQDAEGLQRTDLEGLALCDSCQRRYHDPAYDFCYSCTRGRNRYEHRQRVESGAIDRLRAARDAVRAAYLAPVIESQNAERRAEQEARRKVNREIAGLLAESGLDGWTVGSLHDYAQSGHQPWQAGASDADHIRALLDGAAHLSLESRVKIGPWLEKIEARITRGAP